MMHILLLGRRTDCGDGGVGEQRVEAFEVRSCWITYSDTLSTSLSREERESRYYDTMQQHTIVMSQFENTLPN